jgi:hypothetical protein
MGAAMRAAYRVNKVTIGGVFGVLRAGSPGIRRARPLRVRAAGGRSGRAVGLLGDPGDEPLDVGVGPQGFERVVVALEFFVVQDGVDVPVAGRAEADGAVDLLPVEGLFVALVFVARPRDEVVPRQPPYRPTAEPALPASRAVNRVHRRILSPRGRAAGERVRGGDQVIR